jgi:hypothetical protein
MPDLFGQALAVARGIAGLEFSEAPAVLATSQVEERPVAHNHGGPLPGGCSLQYKATTHLRLSRSLAIRDGTWTVNLTAPKSLDGPQYIAGNTMLGTCTAHCTAVAWDAIVAALRIEEARPKKSCWDWIRNPAL